MPQPFGQKSAATVVGVAAPAVGCPLQLGRGRCGVRIGKKREDGAVAVETALVSMLLITILYGVVEVSFLLHDALNVSAASRAGSRMGASLARDPSFATASRDQVAAALGGLDLSRVNKVWVFKANATTGKPDTGSYTSCTACVRYKGSPTGLVADGGAGWAAVQQNACANQQDQLGVYVEYRYSSRLGFLFSGKVLSESTVMRLEPYRGTGACK